MLKSHSSISERSIVEDLRPQGFNILGKIWVALLIAVCVVGLYAYSKQLRYGLVVTDMRDYTTWGIYISNFVFFVAISLVGSLISAILKLSNVPWRTPLTRIAEVIAIAAIVMAAITIVIDMGRPDRFFYVITHARIQSPITWDVMVIGTYLVLSLLLLYIPLIPDLAIYKDDVAGLPSWQRRVFKFLSLGWKGTVQQKKILKKSVNTLAVMIIPVAFAIHTVTSWLFAATTKPGWDSTNFGPYFVSGAFMVGAAGVIAVMYCCRKFLNLGRYFPQRVFDNMGKLLVLLSLVYLYFNINEYFMPAYKMKGLESEHLADLIYGEHSIMFWSVQIFGMIIPIVVLLFKKGRRPLPLFVISCLVIVGAWFKRFLIVVPSLSHPVIPTDRVPEGWMHYFPTWEEWAITGFTLALALLIVTYLMRIFPIVPVAEKISESRKENET